MSDVVEEIKVGFVLTIKRYGPHDFYPFVDDKPAEWLANCKHCSHYVEDADCAPGQDPGDERCYAFCGPICGAFDPEGFPDHEHDASGYVWTDPEPEQEEGGSIMSYNADDPTEKQENPPVSDGSSSGRWGNRRASLPLVTRLEDAAMVLATAPLNMDEDAGKALADDCAEGATTIKRLENQAKEFENMGAQLLVQSDEIKRLEAEVEMRTAERDTHYDAWTNAADQLTEARRLLEKVLDRVDPPLPEYSVTSYCQGCADKQYEINALEARIGALMAQQVVESLKLRILDPEERKRLKDE